MSSPSRPEGGLPDQHLFTVEWARHDAELAALSRRLTSLEDRVEDHAGAFDALEAAVPQVPPPAAPAVEPTGEAPTPGSEAEADEYTALDMRRLVAWVRDNVALVFERKLPQGSGYPYWCRKWWMHPEAIVRFEAARRSWAEAVVAGDGNAMPVYLEHLDHQLGILFGENGPFSGCTLGTHSAESRARPLGHDDPDEQYFLDFEQSRDQQAS